MSDPDTKLLRNTAEALRVLAERGDIELWNDPVGNLLTSADWIDAHKAVS